MTITCVRESYTTSSHLYEHEVARRWYALSPDVRLPLSSGSTCRLVFAGRPGSAAGPDVRDAVLHFNGQAQPAVGDIEFHVRASDWLAHQHHSDARYNNVILHVVLICDNTSPALRQDGTALPMCSLNDLAPPTRIKSHVTPTSTWPCHLVMQHASDQQRTRLLRQAGLLRFEQKAHTFVELLHNAHSQEPFSACDACLIAALAEGLGYGRDRAFFRAAGQYLLGLSHSVPEPLGRTFDPPPLDASRLSILKKLIQQWRITGAWEPMREIIVSINPDRLHALRAIFAGLGTARADILICNAILPFAVAVALIEHDSKLAEQAQALYLEHPGLSSNRITRAMCEQLQLDSEPQGACQQQGLHYIYQQTCREKQCVQCLAGKSML